MANVWIILFGISFIFFMTTLGAAVVFFFKNQISSKINAFFLGLASGVMIAASVWSLLLPAIAQAQLALGRFAFLPAAAGLLLGGGALVLLDKVLPEFSAGGVYDKKNMRLFLAVTLHNIPEGLAVGFAFGAAASQALPSAYVSALMLAIGIGIQNFPEGAALALPLKTQFNSNPKAFLWASASGVVEPIFATLGYFLASVLQAFQPWFLAFSAGTMVFVAANDLIPDSKGAQADGKCGAWGVLLGFVVMMTLDVALA